MPLTLHALLNTITTKSEIAHRMDSKVIFVATGAHDGKKGVGARNAHTLMSFSVSYLFPADIE